MGNICRSPAAEGVLLHLLKEKMPGQTVTVDSAGTIDFHTGKLADARIRMAAEKRGLNLEHRARQVNAGDLKKFDLILAMDRENIAGLKSLGHSQKFAHKFKLFCEFCTEHDETEVPDPYHGGPEGFEHVLDLLEDGCTEIVRRIQNGTLVKS